MFYESFSFTGPRAVPNDDFADAIVLSNKVHTLKSANWAGTREQGEPGGPGGKPFDQTLWWKYIPPESGTLVVYSADYWDYNLWKGLPKLNERLTDGSGVNRVRVEAGESYYFQVQAPDPSYGGVGIILNGDIPNDRFQNATELRENEVFAGYIRAELSAWYSWVAPYDGMAELSAVAIVETLPLMITLYRGSSAAALQPVSERRFSVRAGESYYVQVNSSRYEDWPFRIQISSRSASVPNDDFAQAEMLSGLSFSSRRTLNDATSELKEPMHLAGPQKSIWWRYKAPDNGAVLTFNVSSTPAGEAVAAIYKGATFEELIPLSDSGPDIPIALRPNEEIKIAVAARAEATGEILLTGSVVAGPDTRLPQTIIFPPIGDVLGASAPVKLNGRADSGLPLEYFVDEGPAFVEGDFLRLSGSGSVFVRARQRGNANYRAAVGVGHRFAVRKRAQEITFDPVDVTAEPIKLRASSSSGLPVSFEVVNGSATLANDSTLVDVDEGPITIRAQQGGNADFYPATPVIQTFVAKRVPQRLEILRGPEQTTAKAFAPNANTTIDSRSTEQFAAAIAEAGSEIELFGMADSLLPVSLRVVSGPGALSGNVLRISGRGEIVVEATQPGDSIFRPASATRILTIGRPLLSARMMDSRLLLSWPNGYSTFRLEAAEVLDGPWVEVPLVSGETSEKLVERRGNKMFFRLKQR
jgi:hypothetical protein